MEPFHGKQLIVVCRSNGKRSLEIGPVFGWKGDLIWCVYEISERLVNNAIVIICS